MISRGGRRARREHIDEQLLDRGAVMVDLVIAAGPPSASGSPLELAQLVLAKQVYTVRGPDALQRREYPG